MPLAIVSTTMRASEVDAERTNRLFANAINMTTSHGTLGDNVGSLYFGGVINPESSTHLLLIFPKHTSKMATETEF